MVLRGAHPIMCFTEYTSDGCIMDINYGHLYHIVAPQVNFISRSICSCKVLFKREVAMSIKIIIERRFKEKVLRETLRTIDEIRMQALRLSR